MESEKRGKLFGSPFENAAVVLAGTFISCLMLLRYYSVEKNKRLIDD